MGDMVEKDFFVEWMQKLYQQLDGIRGEQQSLLEEQRMIREEISIIREQVGMLVTDHAAVHSRLDMQQREIDRIKAHIGLNRTEH